MKNILLFLFVLIVFGCKTDKTTSEEITLKFSSASNNVLSGEEVVFVGKLGAGTVIVTLDSVFMDIPTDDISFAYRKGSTMTTSKGTVILSSKVDSGVFMLLGSNGNGYFCELNTGERLVQFDVESVEK